MDPLLQSHLSPYIIAARKMVVLAPVVLVKLLAGGIAVLAALRNGLGLYAWMETEKLERPSYQVIAKLDHGIEVRTYDPYMIAETTVDGVGFREPTASGFRVCAEYIFGKNQKAKNWSSLNPLSKLESTKSEKMAMTAPVRISGQTTTTTTTVSGEKMAMTAPVRVAGGSGGSKNKKTKVSFVIGKKYNKKTAPVPLNNNVKLREIPSHILAVRTFSGPPPKDERVAKERVLLEQALSAAGLQAKSNSETLVYGYHDPFITPNFLRRNEVAVLLEGSI
jgi:hypothetical protein